MSGEPFASAAYYFWKWADNDLAGPPREVQAALLRGEMHAALQAFDARPLLRKLGALARQGRLLGEEWNWQVEPAGAPQRAHFVFAECPAVDRAEAAMRRFLTVIPALEISGFDEAQGILIQGLAPKINQFFLGQAGFDRAYDVAAAELPGLLKRIRPKERNPFGILENRRSHFVQCFAKGRRFIVEWRENHDLGDPSKFDHWKAQDRVRLEALDAPYASTEIPRDRDPDLITYSGTLKIFRAFLHGEGRPEEYHWRKINAELP